ncbi:hypothetical protein P43SY_005212 [Pythium insidiosum]|uniref:Anaphase-promoting complex subunit 5 n=1 Tax=Pythium insidiosum TaxID=114742 RepID=A0AAD5LQJ5_PYTIN|nr:hypothetical protein P43SY_005212 [Pythium insidiosum]
MGDTTRPASGYALVISLLIAAFVRHHQDDGQRPDAETSLLSAAEDDHKSLARASVHALARFLCHEIQRPPQSTRDDATSLRAVFQRMDAAIADKDDAAVLMDEVLCVLQRVDSPDAVSDIVDAVHECVSTRSDAASDPSADSATSLLARKSLLGVFVRRVVLSVHRLLFDGLSRLYGQVVAYRDAFMRDAHPQRGRSERQRRPSAHDRSDLSISATASPASGFLWKDSGDMEDLPLSPITSSTSSSAVPGPPTLQLSSSALDASSSSSPPLRSSHPPRSHPPSSLSHDQLQFMLHDLVVDVERGRLRPSNQRVPHRSATASDALFATYLDAVARREFDTALDALHQYHDVALASTMRLRRALRAAATATAAVAAGTAAAGGAPPPSTSAAASASRLHFLGSGVQYAALNLAGLHLAFDRLRAASDSLQEAIRVAQHHGDHICVAIALAWLIRAHQAQGHSQRQVAALLSSALDRAEELGLPSLQALAVFAAIDDELQRGSPKLSASLVAGAVVAQVPHPRPLHVWSQLESVAAAVRQMGARVPSLSLNASGGGAGAGAGRTLGQLAGAGSQQPRASDGGMRWRQSVESVLRSIWRLSSRACVVAAVAWRQLGSRELSGVLDSVFWSAYHAQASVAELAAWIRRSALLQAETPGDVLGDTRPQELAFVVALRYLVHLIRRVASATTSSDEATDMCRLLLQEPSIQRTIHELFAQWSCHRGELCVAEAHLESVRALCPAHRDMPSHLESVLLLADLHGARRSMQTCFELLDELETTCRGRSYSRLLAQVLLVRGRCTLQASGPIEALPSVVAAIDLATTHHWDLLLADAHVMMAQIYVAMGRARDAIQVLNGQMSTVMEHGSLRLRGDAMLMLAKASLASRRHAAENAAGIDKRVQALLHESEQVYRQLDSWARLQEIEFLRANLSRLLDDADAAVEHATSFLQWERLRSDALQRKLEPDFGTNTIPQLERSIAARLVPFTIEASQR